MPNDPPKLLGEYETLRFDCGDVVECARRGEVRIVGLSSAPIPWPIGHRDEHRARRLKWSIQGAAARAEARLPA